jgi:hypothetical protein
MRGRVTLSPTLHDWIFDAIDLNIAAILAVILAVILA